MERRLVTFIVASTAFFLAYMAMRTMFVPPLLPPEPGKLADTAVIDGPDPVEADATTQPDADAEPADDSALAKRPDQAEWLTLGSMDPASKHVMLVTLTNLGSGLERLELTERDENQRLKYRRVDVRSGYMGYIAGNTDESGLGVRVNVIGPGTPIATATLAEGDASGNPGIAVGDLIIAVNNKAVASYDDIERALAETLPGQKVVVEVERSNGNSVTTLRFSVTLSEHPLDLVRLAKTGGADQVKGNLSRLSCLMTLAQVNRRKIDLDSQTIAGLKDPTQLLWTSERSSDQDTETATYSLEMSAAEMKAVGAFPVRLKRSYSVRPGEYAIDMSVQVDNLHTEPQKLAYRLEGVNGVTLEGWWYSNKISPNFRGGAAARDIVFKKNVGGHQLLSGFNLLSEAKASPPVLTQNVFVDDGSETAEQLRYVGVDAQYFTVAYVPPTGEVALANVDRADAGIVANASEIPRHQERAVNASFMLDSKVAEIPAGGSVSQELRVFAGPKKPEVLAQYGLSECLYYGWFWWAAIPLAYLLHGLYWVIGNYAIAIIMLTVLVRGCMFPLSRKAAINAQRMQELAPEMKKIKEKFKDDLEGQMKANRELQARVGFNPMAGCLPMFMQLPIFIGLYRTLSVDIELRQAAVSPSLQWASNLAGPDMLYYWGDWMMEYFAGRGTGWLGPYFNVLPIIVVGLFLTQQKLFMPPATDEQQEMTQKVMNFMTLFMGVFFFKVPAGLCIYFVTSSLWGICERILVKKTLPATKHFDAGVLEGTATPTNAAGKATTGKKSITERIQERMNPPVEPMDRPNKRRRPDSNKKKR